MNIKEVMDNTKKKMAYTYCDIRSIPAMRRASKRTTKNDRIKIAFLCQSAHTWNKFEKFYRELLNDKRFEVLLVCIPKAIEKGKLKPGASIKNEVYDYFCLQGYDAINALVGRNKWLDLKKIGCDYIVYSCPYNSKFPKEYNSSVVKEYANIVSILYSAALTSVDYDLVFNLDFFKDAYIFLADTKESENNFKSRFWFTYNLGIRKCILCGATALETLLEDKEKRTYAWDFSKNNFRIMWTPRWTTDKIVGGSNFFMYYKFFLNYAKDNPDVDILIRPHPLMFNNFIKTRQMSKKEVDSYKKQIEELPNVKLDESPEYGATLWNTDVLITDIGGLMYEYFVTGKPMVYCVSTIGSTFLEHTKEMFNGCYIVENKTDMLHCIKELKSGNDTLKLKREHIVFKLRKNNRKHVLLMKKNFARLVLKK